ncbi:MAG: hypothetical protein E7497_07340 [Ruminococcus sp.]|nr:hypothetical protein [Ruminococcus sp.]
MEAVLGIIIIAVLCVCFGVSTDIIIFGFVLLAGFTLLSMLLLFAYSVLCLILSTGKDAEFVRFDKSPKGGYKVAYYSSDGKEYPCIFPCESLLLRKFYTNGKKHRVRISRIRYCVFDVFACITSILGLFFSSALAAAVVYILLFV